jgi:hypothetical protein
MTKRFLFSIIILIAAFAQSYAQDSIAQKRTEYKKVVTQRADKIVAKLGISDSIQYNNVVTKVAQQYIDLNDIYEARDAKVKALKASAGTNKQAIDTGRKIIDAEVNAKLDKLHPAYLSELSKTLTQKQVEAVKDGMTYGVLPITYKAYQDMIPTLTEPQKAQILTWLTEAREHAMDAESSDKKHAWFGKYKGRINNYLSAQGYDSKKEREEWEKRIQAAKASKQ